MNIGDGSVRDAAPVHDQRAAVYRVLADCFLSPEHVDGNALETLQRGLQGSSPSLRDKGRALAALLPEDAASVESLCVAHARLFIGPFDLLAPPYSSVYLDGERIVLGPSAQEVQQRYKAAGVEMPGESSGPPDHVVAELEFMYYLAFQYASTGFAHYLDASRAFLHVHLARWFPAFAARVQEYAPHLFYCQLAVLAADFVAWDERRLTSDLRGSG